MVKQLEKLRDFSISIFLQVKGSDDASNFDVIEECETDLWLINQFFFLKSLVLRFSNN